MKDKDWLNRISLAYKVYPTPDTKIQEFISWLYKQYGIIEKKDDK